MDESGRLLEELILAEGLEVLNRPLQPATYWTPHCATNIDITLATHAMSRRCPDSWEVRADCSISDHRVIYLEVRGHRDRAQRGQVERRDRFSMKTASWDVFDREITERLASLPVVVEDTPGFVDTRAVALQRANDR